jgi:UV DNA damage endonuclease
MDHKIILHIGGVYGDKLLAVKRFVTNFKHLPVSITGRIVVENDDKSFNICDVLDIGSVLRVPVVFDNLHNAINPCNRQKNDVSIINECKNTWKRKDGVQKIHYSQQDPNKRPGSHSNSIFVDEFINFIDSLGRDDIDIMLEVKDKNLSALNCMRRLSLKNRYNL